MTRRRYALLAALSVVVALTATLLVLLAVDIYLHWKHERVLGLNVWGYRGPTVGRKAPGSQRIAVFGGSTAFGYGPAWDESFPYLLEQRLKERGRYSVVNLAYNNEAAYSFRFTMEDYAYLDYDVVVLYEGYNDLGDEPRYQVFRRESPFFRLTGYMPIFPLIFREKAWSMMYGGDITRGYREKRAGPETTAFQPGLATAATAKALETAARTAESLERQLGRLTIDVRVPQPVTPSESCPDLWQHYCGSMRDAVAYARARGNGVVVVTQPFVSDRHVSQQTALMGMLQHHFGADRAVRHANLGAAVDLKDKSMQYDGVHLTRKGNQLIADALAPHVLEIAAVVAGR
jgi:lysophospholipase L1-like esterase